MPGYNPIFEISVGCIMVCSTATLPSGWLSCNGTNVSRTTYSELFTAIGTRFGVGNGSTTFGLPNLAGLAVNVVYIIYTGQ